MDTPHDPAGSEPAATRSRGPVGAARALFSSRLASLQHILDRAEAHFGTDDAFVHERLAPDMFPLGTQVAFACNQPRSFAQWCAGEPVVNLPAEVPTLATARRHVTDTIAQVSAIEVPDRKLDEIRRIELGGGRYCELTGHEYLSEFLIPNFYFHITTAYAILRSRGVPVGKQDFMSFLLPRVRQGG